MAEEAHRKSSEKSRIPLKAVLLQYTQPKVSGEKRPVLLKEYVVNKFDKAIGFTGGDVACALGIIGTLFSLCVLLGSLFWMPEDMNGMPQAQVSTVIAPQLERFVGIVIGILVSVPFMLLIIFGWHTGNKVDTDEVELLTASAIQKLPPEVMLVRASATSTFDGERVLLRVAEEAPQEQLLRPVKAPNARE